MGYRNSAVSFIFLVLFTTYLIGQVDSSMNGEKWIYFNQTNDCSSFFTGSSMDMAQVFCNRSFNSECQLLPLTVFWQIQKTKGYFFIDIYPELIVVHWASNDSRIRGFGGAFKITKNHYDAISELLDSSRIELIKPIGHGWIRENGELDNYLREWEYLNIQEEQYNLIANRAEHKFYEYPVLSLGLKKDLRIIMMEINKAFGGRELTKLDTNVININYLYLFDKQYKFE